MKLTLRTIFCFTLLFLCAYPLQAQDGKTDSTKKNGNISSKYNKSKNLTTVGLKSMALRESNDNKTQSGYVQKIQMDMDAFFTYPGEKVEKPPEAVTLRFKVTANNYIFARPQTISVVLDEKIEGGNGRLLKLGDTDYKSDLKFNTVFEEYLMISIPSSVLGKIAEAKTISIFVGPYSFLLREKQVADLRDFANLAKP